MSEPTWIAYSGPLVCGFMVLAIAFSIAGMRTNRRWLFAVAVACLLAQAYFAGVSARYTTQQAIARIQTHGQRQPVYVIVVNQQQQP
jgi:hypothetical protein